MSETIIDNDATNCNKQEDGNKQFSGLITNVKYDETTPPSYDIVKNTTNITSTQDASTNSELDAEIVALIPDLKDIIKNLSKKDKTKILTKCIKKLKKSFNIKINDSYKDVDIAAKLLEEYKFFKQIHINKDSKEFYNYEDYRYKLITNDIVFRYIIKTSVKEAWSCSSSKLNAVSNSLKSLCDEKPDRLAGLIAFRNGVKNAITQEFLQHDKSHGIETYIDCDYNAQDTQCPIFDDVVNTWAKGKPERVELILFSLYLHFANRYDLKLYTEIVGESNTGKSIFMKLIELFVGEECCKYTSFKALENEKHTTAYLTGALSILIPEAGKNFGTFEVTKAIIGGDKISHNPKNDKIYFGRMPSLIGVFSNDAMVIPEETTAMYNRRVLVHFDNIIDKENQNRNILNDLKKELPAIANKLITYFTPEKVAECEQLALSNEDKKQTLIATDTIYRFIHECVGVHKDDCFKDQWVQLGSKKNWREDCADTRIKRAKIKLYDCYLLFCEAEGLKAIGLSPFKIRLLMHLTSKFGIAKNTKFKKIRSNRVVLEGVYLKIEDCCLFDNG